MGNLFSKETTEKVYTGTAELGKISIYISIIFGTIFSIILIALGIFFLTKKQNTVLATVTAINKDGTITVSYTVGKNKCTANISQETSNYNVGNTFVISYNSSNPCSPDEVSLKVPYKTIGGVLLGFGIFILIGVWTSFFFRKNKMYDAAVGVRAMGEAFGI